jgi:dTMP kinase
MFITLEGAEGSGKSTQGKLLARYLEMQPDAPSVLLTREPGGTPIGDQIRAVLLNPGNTVEPLAEMLLYAASRAQLVHGFIKPHLAQGAVVICDRYIDSTFAYQGYGRGLALNALRQITTIATGGLLPDLTLFLDISPEEGIQRRLNSAKQMDRLDKESMAFHQRVYAGYQQLMAEDSTGRWQRIDARQPINVVQKLIRDIVEKALTDL